MLRITYGGFDMLYLVKFIFFRSGALLELSTVSLSAWLPAVVCIPTWYSACVSFAPLSSCGVYSMALFSFCFGFSGSWARSSPRTCKMGSSTDESPFCRGETLLNCPKRTPHSAQCTVAVSLSQWLHAVSRALYRLVWEQLSKG